MTDIPGVEFRPLTVPASMDAADAAEFAEYTRVRNEIARELTGRDDDTLDPTELLPHYQPSSEQIRHAWGIFRDARQIGRMTVDIPLEDGSHGAFWLIELLREHWGQGIGSAAYALVEQTAREHCRTVLQSWGAHPDESEDVGRVPAPTGHGSIPKDHVARFYLRHGYALEQVERESALDLAASIDTVARLRAAAERAAAGYRIVQWTAPTPPEYTVGYAWMKSRMSTDTPMGALEFDEEAWDAERVALHDARIVDGGRTMLVTAAQHVETGDLVAFNELVIGADPHRASQQEDTLVLKEHRGHRLGQLVKCAGLETWRARIAPQSPRVITYNAEENRPMLDINEAIGFVPVAYNGAWQKVLT